jgi:hypothetical protein
MTSAMLQIAYRPSKAAGLTYRTPSCGSTAGRPRATDASLTESGKS